MAENPSDSIKTNVIGGVLTAAVLAIGAAVWAFAPNAWKWITGLLGSIWAHLTSAATVPTWWLYLLYLVGLAAVLTVAAQIHAAAAADPEPTFTDYTQDHFFGALWRWRYALGRPVDTLPFCPTCDTMLVYWEGHRDLGVLQTVLHCETCRTEVTSEPGDRHYFVAKVERQIDRKVRSGEWKNSVTRAAKART